MYFNFILSYFHCKIILSNNYTRLWVECRYKGSLYDSKTVMINTYFCSMKKTIVGIFCGWISIFSSLAQSSDSAPLSYTVHDEETEEIWEFWIQENERTDEFRAWRILAAGVESRRNLDNEILKFKRSFPELSYDWAYDPPLYKLKTGIFLERLDAKPLLYKIKEHFPAALEIRDKVAYEDYFEARAE